MEYCFPQYDRKVFMVKQVHRKDILETIQDILLKATEHYKTNTYVVEAMDILDTGYCDIYIITRR